MRIAAFSIGLLALLTPLSAAFSKEDHEIFRVRDELLAHLGPDATFYDFLGVTPSASQDDINKAYRKRTRALHPDKVKQQLSAERVKAAKEKAKFEGGAGSKGKKPGVTVTKPPSQAEIRAAIKKASELQTRLSVIAEILRGEGRARYDHFLSHGFPTWKGTGYYYNRYRPGFGTVMFGLFLFVGGAAHYIALYMGWKRQREFVERYIKFARHAAWGNDGLGLGIPGVDGQPAAVPAPAPVDGDDERPVAVAVNRRQRRMQEKENKGKAKKEGGRRGARRAAASGTATPTAAALAGQGPTGAKKRVVAENGKVLVVDSLGDVYLEQEDEEGSIQEFLLDPNELARPTIKDTALYRLPAWAYTMTIGRVFPAKESSEADDADLVELVDDDEDSEPGKATPSTDSNEDFELLEKSTDSLGQAKTTGSQAAGKARSNKRKSKKR